MSDEKSGNALARLRRAVDRAAGAVARQRDVQASLREIAAAACEATGADVGVVVGAPLPSAPGFWVAEAHGLDPRVSMEPLIALGSAGRGVAPAPPIAEVGRAAGLPGASGAARTLDSGEGASEPVGYLALLFRGSVTPAAMALAETTLAALAGHAIAALGKAERTFASIRERSDVEATLDAVPDVVYVVDSALRIRFVNAAWIEAASANPGLRRDAIVGRPLLERMEGPVADRWRTICERILRSRAASPDASHVEVLPIDRGGRVETRELHATALRDASGAATGIVFVSSDVTGQRAASDRARLRDWIVDQLREAVIVLDRDGNVTLWNAWAETMLGWTAEEMAGTPLQRLFPRGGPDGSGPASVRGELQAQRKDGTTVWIEVHVTPLGQPRTGERPSDPTTRDPVAAGGAIVVAREVSRERSLRAQLMQSERLASIGKIASGVFHEIKNPATFVHSNLILLRDQTHAIERLMREYRLVALGHGPPDKIDALRDLEEALRLAEIEREMPEVLSDTLVGMEHIRNVVRELGTLSRRSDAPPRMVDPNGFVGTAVTVASVELRRAGGVHKNLSVVPAVVCDESQLAQVVLNLLVNAAQALQARPRRENRVEVTTRTGGTAGDWVEIEVADNGPGIAPENIERIFEAFFTTKPVGEGSGLGLSICREIVHRHGGTLTVRSRPGEGATFLVRLPAARQP